MVLMILEFKECKPSIEIHCLQSRETGISLLTGIDTRKREERVQEGDNKKLKKKEERTQKAEQTNDSQRAF